MLHDRVAMFEDLLEATNFEITNLRRSVEAQNLNYSDLEAIQPDGQARRTVDRQWQFTKSDYSCSSGGTGGGSPGGGQSSGSFTEAKPSFSG